MEALAIALGIAALVSLVGAIVFAVLWQATQAALLEERNDRARIILLANEREARLRAGEKVEARLLDEAKQRGLQRAAPDPLDAALRRLQRPRA